MILFAVEAEADGDGMAIREQSPAVEVLYGDDEDPPEMYKVDVLRGAREEIDRLLVESYVETVNKIDSLTTPTKFCTEYPEVSRALNHLEGSADDVAQAIFNLYRRHAEQVCGAIDAAGRAAISELRRHELPPTCMLSIAFAGSRKLDQGVAVEEQADAGKLAGTGARADGDGRQKRADQAVPLVVDEASFSIRWENLTPLAIGNRKEFRLLQSLASSPNRYLPFADLAQQLGGDEMDEITHVKSRLVKMLKEKGYGALADRIKTQKGHYGLFLS